MQEARGKSVKILFYIKDFKMSDIKDFLENHHHPYQQIYLKEMVRRYSGDYKRFLNIASRLCK